MTEHFSLFMKNTLWLYKLYIHKSRFSNQTTIFIVFENQTKH